MMWRVLAALDFITIMEVHFGLLFPTPALGVSTGPHFAVGAWAWKFDKKCLLGPIPINTPPTLGHDAGIMRPHILIDLSLLPPPPLPPATPLNSAVTSAKATLCSAMKPTFSASRDIRAGSPVSTEMLPYGAGIILSGDVPCGIGGPHKIIPMIPTQLTDWSGLTLGDMIGGLVNMYMETLCQAALETVSAILPGGKYLGWGDALTVAVGYGSATGISTWPSGTSVSVPVQQAVDNAMSSPSGASSSSSGSSSSGAASSGSGSSGSGSGASGASGSSGSSGAGGKSSGGSSDVCATPSAPGTSGGWSPFGQAV